MLVAQHDFEDIHKALFIKTFVNILTDNLCYIRMYLARHQISGQKDYFYLKLSP